MRKLTSLLLLFICGIVTSLADYEVGTLLTAAEVNAGVESVCLKIDQDQGNLFYITSEGTGSNEFITTDKTCVFDFVKRGSRGVVLRNCDGQYLVNNVGTMSWSSNIADAALFKATQREDGVGNCTAPSSETVILQDQGSDQNLNSIQISSSRSNKLIFNAGTGVWVSFRVYKVNETAEPEPVPNGPIAAVSDLSNTKQYTVVSNRGSLGSYEGYLATTMTSTTTGYTGTANNFAFLTVDGNTYLYNVTNKAFYTSESAQKYKEVATPEGSVVTLVETDQAGLFSMKFGDNYLNMSANGYDYALVINSWGGAADYWDDGNRLTITAVDDFDATEALAAIDAYLHPAASYKVVVVDSETEKEYTVAEGIAAGIGDVIDAMPDDLKLDYCTYTVAEPLTIAEGSDNTLFVEADYEGLPFEAGKWYYMTVRSRYAIAGENTITSETSMPDASNNAAAWSFSGNPYAGIAVTNRSTGDGYTIGYDAVVVAKPGSDLYMKAGDTRWMISKNSSGFVLRIPENPSIYLHNRTPKLSTCSVTEWAGVHDDAGSTIALVEIPEPIDPAMYTVPVDATVDMTTGTFTEYNAATLEESKLATRWVSNESPKIDFYCTGGNNMVGGSLIFNGHDAGNNLGLFAGKTYQISVEKGYVIAGYTIKGVNMDGSTSTITAGSQSHEFTTEESTFEKTLSEYAYSTSFDVTGTQFLKLNEFTVHLMKAGTPEPVVETFKEGYFNVFNYDTDKVLGVDDINMNTVSIPSIPTEYTAKWTSIVDLGDGTFNVKLPVKTSSGQNNLTISSNNRWSNGDAKAISFYQVADPAAETTVATKVESIDLGATYLIVALSSKTNQYGALTNVLYKAGEGNDQRLESVVVEPADGFITIERNAAAMWTVGAFAETTETKGLKNADVLFRNNADNKFLSAGNPQPETQEFSVIAETVAKTIANQLASYVSSPEEGTFNIQILNETRYAYCGSNGRFSANTAANPLQLFKVANINAETFEAEKVNAFEATGSAWYLVVGTQKDATYALSSTMYEEGKSGQRMEGTAVTIAEGKISIAADNALLWRFIPSSVEIPTFDAPFEPAIEPVGPVDPEPGIEGTFHATNRVKSIEVGKEYMIYNTAWAAGEYALRYGFVYDNSKIAINGLTVPEEFETDNKAYLWKFEDAGEGKYYIKNVATGLYAGTETTMGETKVAFTIADFVDCPSKGSAGSRSVAGERVDVADITAEDAVVYIFNGEKYWNGQNYYNAGENGFVTYEKAHAYAIYEAEEVKVVNNVEVTFHVIDEAEKEVATFKAEYPEGTVIEDIPDEYKKDFCVYTAAEPLTVSAENNEFFAEVSYDLPFVEGQAYYLQANGKYAQFDTNRNVNYFAEVDNGDFTSRPMTLEEIEASEDKALFQWQISGNPYDGYKLYNVGKEQYLVARASGYTVMGDEGTVLDFAVRGEGYTFTCELGTLMDYYGNLCAIANEDQITDALAVFTLVEVPEVLPTYEKTISLTTGEFTISNSNKTWAAKWESRDGEPAISLTTSANNMSGNSDATVLANEGLKIFTGQGGTCTYTIDVETGYGIVGYTIRGNAYSDNIIATDVASSATQTFTNAAEVQEFTVTMDPASSAAFTIGNTATRFLNAVITVQVAKLPTEDVTFSIYDEEETHIYTEVYPITRGTVVKELPDALKRDFTTYTYPVESLEVKKGGHNVFHATAKFEMPFVADGESAYNLTVGGLYAYINEEGAVANASELTEETAKLRNYCWTFSGNPYMGIAVKNVDTEQYLKNAEVPDGEWAAPVELSNEPVYWSLYKNGEGFALRIGEPDYLAVYNESTISTYSWVGLAGQAASRLTVTAATPEVPTPVEVEVTVNVVDGEGNVLDTATMTAMTGDVISEVPAVVKARPLSHYAVAEPLRVTKGENVLNVEVSFDEVPFLSVAGQDPKWFNITVADRVIGAIYDSANDVWKAVGYSSTEEGVLESPLTQWAVYGNPYGFKLLNKQSEGYLGYGAEDGGVSPALAAVEATDATASWPLEAVNDGRYSLERLMIGGESVYRLGDGYASVISPSELTFVAVAGGEPPVTEDNYTINFDKDQTYTQGDRCLLGISLGEEAAVVAEAAGTDKKMYTDLRDSDYFTLALDEEAAPAVDWYAAGKWMHTYVYVDYGRDGQFNVEETAIENGVIGEGQDIVSFSYFNGYNSAGQSVADGPGTIDLPTFEVPEGVQPGYYAMRYKIDWNNVDPGGNATTKNPIINNRGSIADIRLNIHAESVNVTGVYESADGTVTLNGAELSEAAVAPFGEELTFRFAPAAGKKVERLVIRHGYLSGEEYVHGIRQFATEEIDGSSVTSNRYYMPIEWSDGDIEITAVFGTDTGIQNINGLNNDDEVYGVDGRRLNQRNILNKGVYVINGKKVLVK